MARSVAPGGRPAVGGNEPLRTLVAVHRLQSHGDQPSLQNSERGFDSLATCGIVVQRENAWPALRRCEFESRRFHCPSRPMEGHRKTDPGTAKSGAREPASYEHPWTSFTGNAVRGGVSSGLRMHRASSRKGGAGKRVSQTGSLRAHCGFDSRLGHDVSRTSFNGRTAAFHTADAGSIPAVRSLSRFSEEDRGLQNRARGFDSLSALRPTRPTEGHSPSKRSDPGSIPGWGAPRPRRLVAQDL